MTAAERRARRTAKYAVRRQPGRAFPTVCLLLAALVFLPMTPALAHSEATSCTHGTVGLFHKQAYLYGKWHNGWHVHTVQLGHLIDSTPEYDAIACRT